MYGAHTQPLYLHHGAHTLEPPHLEPPHVHHGLPAVHHPQQTLSTCVAAVVQHQKHQHCATVCVCVCDEGTVGYTYTCIYVCVCDVGCVWWVVCVYTCGCM